MPRKKKAEVIGTVEVPKVVITTSSGVDEIEVSPEEAAQIPAEEISEDETNKTYAVYDANGAFVRAYTLELHGAEARANAQMYASKIGGSVKS